jgi:hypothetical protein
VINIHDIFQTIEANQKIKNLFGIDKKNNLTLKTSHLAPYVLIRYRQNANNYNKILDNHIVKNLYQIITFTLLLIVNTL